MSVIAMIPAHDEEGGIASAIASLAGQAVAFDRVVVVADNCSDSTADIARTAGAEVFLTVGNSDKKAGALNQALAAVPLSNDDVLLVMDADTRLGADYMREVWDRLTDPADGPALGAVGGIFHGDRSSGLLERLQAAEYARYARETGRRKGQVHVLTGTASVFRVSALREVAAARGTRLPGRRGEVYDTNAITEDNEITLALKTLGWGLISPRKCLVYTELMPNLGALHHQRLRWYRGAIDNVFTYGWSPVTRRYWGQQAMLLVSSVMLCLYVLLMAFSAVGGGLTFSWFWTCIGAVFAVERVVSVWRAGRAARFTAALILPELLYDLFLQVAFFRAVAHRLRGSRPEWRHATRVPQSGSLTAQHDVVPNR